MAGFRHLISLQAEQSLIAAAQGGSRDAVETLVRLDRPFIRSLAAQVCRRIIHRPDVRTDLEDLEAIGVTEFVASIRRYDAAKANGCRMRNFAFPSMKYSMTRHACDGLEIVPLSGGHKVHAAHRDHESGLGDDEIRQKHGLAPEVVRSLHRGTVSLSKLQEEDAEPGADPYLDEDALAHDVHRRRAWTLLDSTDREVLDEMRVEPSLRERARVAGVSLVEQVALERRALRHARQALERVAAVDEGDVADLALDGRVWRRLRHVEREVVAAHVLGCVNPRCKGAFLGVGERRAVEIERQTWDAVRRLALAG